MARQAANGRARTVVDVAVARCLLQHRPAANLFLDPRPGAKVERLERRHLDGGDPRLVIEPVEVVVDGKVAGGFVEVQRAEGGSEVERSR